MSRRSVLVLATSLFASSLLAACQDRAPAPDVLSVEPELSCLPGLGVDELVLTVTGTDLAPLVADGLTDEPRLVGGAVHLRRLRDPRGSEVGNAEVVIGADSGRLQVLGPDQLELTLDPGLALDPGVWGIDVPDAAGAIGQPWTELALSGRPELTLVDPDGLCTDAQDRVALTVTGSGMVAVDGGLPRLVVGDQELEASAVDGCFDVPGGARFCTEATFDVEPGGLPIGALDLSLRNPSPVDCAEALPISLQVAPAPEIESVEPGQACTTGAELTIHGEHFVDGMELTVGGVLVEDFELLDERTLVAWLDEGVPGAGAWDVTLTTPGGCEAFAEAAVMLSLPPLVFAVDPPVVPTGAPLRITALVSDVFDEVTDVWLQDETGSRQAADWTWDAEQPGEVGIALPDTLAEGDWTIVVDQGSGCPGQAGAAFEVTDDHVIGVGAVDPAFAWTYDWTAVEIQALDPLPGGSVGFDQGIRGWLVDPSGVGASVRLAGMVWRDDATLSAVVPYGLEVGSWDLLLVDADGRSGHLPGAVAVVEDPPPRIDSVSPGTLPNSSDQAVVIRGRHFRDPTVSLTCLESGVERSYTVDVDASSATRIDATVPTTSIGEAVCVVVVVDDDGTMARYSAISVTNPAQNLFPWQAGTELNVARRAPGSVAGRSTERSRWVYAIGGDDGDATGALASVEVASVGVYGELGPWRVLSRGLPDARTLAATAIVGRFVYLVGGSGATSADGDAVATTWRAMILDPLDVPWFDGLSLNSDADGLSAGRWTWRVAAVYADDDLSNPGGEGLAGDPVQVSLPEVEGGWKPTIRWLAVDGAVAYRVYRSAEADAPVGEEYLLAEVDALSWTDVGDAVDRSVPSQEEGALGAWAALSELTVPRRSPCVAVAPDPFPDPEIVYVYAAGGADEDGDVLDSIERLPVIVEGPRFQSTEPWEPVDARLSEARERCGAMVVDSSSHTVVGDDDVRVYFAGGVTSRRSTGTVDTAWVDEGGELQGMEEIDGMSPARAGFAAASASNFLYAFGGQNDSASTGGVSAELQPDLYPDVRNWNSLGTSLHEAKWLPGGAQESAVIIVVGGADDAGAATTSTDWTNY
ncbi:MAG: hypothetical protein H6742_01350 [Alphaproteobacteria bacterium]|nr:hypothetical protein [Alphaproteobacteria bacterium]